MKKNIIVWIVSALVLLGACVALGARLPGESMEASETYISLEATRHNSDNGLEETASSQGVVSNDATDESADSSADDVSSGGLAHTASPGVLRVVAPSSEWIASRLSPYGPGFEQELLQSFAKGMNMAVAISKADSPEAAWASLEKGSADLLVGSGFEVPSIVGGPIMAGPAYAHFKPTLVRSKKRHGLRSPGDLCQVPVLVTANPVLEERLSVQGVSLNCSPQAEKVKDFGMDPVLNTLNDNQARFALVDSGSFRLWQPFFTNVRPASQLSETIPYRWFWPTDDNRMATALDQFWQYQEETSMLDELTEKYFGFFPEKTDYYDLRTLLRTVQEDLPKYQDIIETESIMYDLDPLLLSAVIYQESRFEHDATSKTGVRGLMMITNATAKMLGVRNRLDPAQSIQGGAKYLAWIYDKLEPLDLEPWDRWFFTLAAYNQGLGHLYDAMNLARKQGGTGKTWRELKKVYPLLAWERYYSSTKHGYCRGYEAVKYVDSIRYYYYVLHGLVTLARPEAQDLGSLAAIAPASWPLRY